MSVEIDVNDLQSLTLAQIAEAVLDKKNKGGDEAADKEKTLDQKAQWVRKVWNNNGFVSHRDQYDKRKQDQRITLTDLFNANQYSDAVSTSDIPILIGRVVSEIVQEAAEPLLTGVNLLQRINFSAAPQITFPASGAIQAFDIAEGMEYPEQTLQVAGTVTVTVGKVGLKLRFTEESIRYSRYDIMGMHLRAAGRALARHKEVKIYNHINSQGTTVFDNSGATSTRGMTTGRDASGSPNGTLTLDDLLDMYAAVIAQGFIPNTLIMHPMAWTIFAKDATLRAWAFAQGGAPIWQSRQGSPGLHPQSGAPGGLGVHYPTPYTATTQTPVPAIFPEPMRVVVTPFVAYDATSYSNPVTSVIMCDSNQLGALVVDEEISTEDWDDPARDIRAMKIRERYGVAILNEGKAIAVAKNIVVAKGYDMDDRVIWDAQAGALPAASGFVLS